MTKSIFSERLVSLCNGTLGLRSQLPIEIRNPASPGGEAGQPEGEPANLPILDFISSDETLDRYDEIISASGWNLATYRRNPVFQNSHQYGDILHTLGKALSTEVRGGKLIQRIQFATDVNPMAKIAYGLYQGKFLNAVSVGFIPVRWENGTEQTRYSRKFLEQELLEVSAVAIPANPNALTLAYKSGAIEKSDLQDTLDLLGTTLKGGAREEKQPRQSTPGESAQLLRIAGDLHELLQK